MGNAFWDALVASREALDDTLPPERVAATWEALLANLSQHLPEWQAAFRPGATSELQHNVGK
eukprot:1929414-Prorocentrum_lima.AAC.1